MKSFALTLALLFICFIPSCAHAQDLVAFATTETSSGATTPIIGFLNIEIAQPLSVVIEYADSDGVIFTDVAIVEPNGLFFGVESPTTLPGGESTMEIAVTEFSTGQLISTGIVVVIVDTDDLGSDWTPLDINDEDNWTGCETVADNIKTKLGGTAEKKRIKPKSGKGPKLGEYRDAGTGWEYHDVIIKKVAFTMVSGRKKGLRSTNTRNCGNTRMTLNLDFRFDELNQF